MVVFVRKIFAYSLLILLLLTPVVMAETLTIEGLSFRCDTCVMESENPCSVKLAATEPSIDCRGALKTLLLEVLADTSYRGKNPAPKEIVSAIKSGDFDSTLVSTLLAILVKTKAGEDRLQQNAGFFVRRYPRELSALLASQPVSDASLMAIWNTQVKEGIVMPSYLAAQIAAGNRNIKVRDFVARMQALSVKTESDLAVFAKEFKAAGRTDVSKSFEAAIAILDSCASSIARCREEETEQLPFYMRAYVGSFLDRRRKEHSDRNALDPGRTLTEIMNSSSASVHGQLRRDRILAALRNAYISEDVSQRLELVRSEALEFLRGEALRDPGIALAVATLLVKASEEEVSRGATTGGADLLEKSFSFYELPIKERTALVERLRNSPDKILDGISTLPARFKQDPVQESAFWFWAVVCLAVLWLWATFVILMRRRADRLLDSEAREDIAQWKADRRKRDLLSFFGLSEKATLEDLTRRYREIVKNSHPDVAQGRESSDRDFAELRKKYEEARDLLFDKTSRR